MGSPYLNSNEAIILSTHNVLINTIPAEAILTSQRLILVDARHTQLRPQDIPFAALETVTIGENSAMDPVLSLSIVVKDETRHTLGIVFPQAPKMKRVSERDEWATKLREAGLASQAEGGLKPADLSPPWIAGDLPEESGEPGATPKPEEEKFYNPPLSPRKPRARPPSGKRTLIAAGLFIVLILAAAAGVYLFAPLFTGSGGTPAQTVATPVITTTATQIPVATVQPTVIMTQPEPTPEVTATATAVPQAYLPQDTGVWVRIEYSGNFSASFGTAGRMRDITGTGVRLYQIPAKDQIVDATAEKLDDSGNVLTVSIYNNGQVIKSGTTTKPRGTAEIHADLRTTAPVTTHGANTTSAG